jgi:antitoxin component YwqK of YwqJK toxin-antitoxin module
VGIIKRDFDHLKDQADAREKGNLVRITHKDGTYEQGIVQPSPDGAKREGLWVHRDQKDKVISTGEFTDGKLNGVYRELDEEKRLRHLGMYQDGTPKGTHSTYDEKGDAVRIQKYENGKLKEDFNPAERKAEMATQRGKGWSFG